MYNLLYEQGEVVEIIKEHKKITFFWMKILGKEKCKAVNYNNITGLIKIGDQVVVNTTAVELGLGTGGYHFVVLNLRYLDKSRDKLKSESTQKKNSDSIDKDERDKSSLIKNDIVGTDKLNKNYNKKINDNRIYEDSHQSRNSGHIMKMRYTPFQIKTLCAEEQMSPYHDVINEFESLNELPVILIPLHSLLAPLSITYKTLFPDKKIVYIMSEGGSLALDFSNLVRKLVSEGYIDNTITFGNAFGGDYESVNIFSALAVASELLKADLIIVGMGPGIVGTSTKYGFSGVENAFIEKAVRILKGKSIVVPRVSFADTRKRHFGISHHSITLLSELITDSIEIALPKNDYLENQINKGNLFSRHNFEFYSIDEVERILEESGFNYNSMGRNLKDDPLFFITAGLAVYKV